MKSPSGLTTLKRWIIFRNTLQPNTSNAFFFGSRNNVEEPVCDWGSIYVNSAGRHSFPLQVKLPRCQKNWQLFDVKRPHFFF